ncbi:polysaccharide deacetylase family protein [Litoreibacter janthinus]|nr:polysaccharide deacetylase family protein [Litoreibacter janthinus]
MSFKQVVEQQLYSIGAPAILRMRADASGSAVVLAYHAVSDDPCYSLPGIRVTCELFKRQMKHLADHYSVVSLDEVANAIRAGDPLPERSVAVTFDDGYEDNFTNAFPVLAAHDLPATIFATSAPVLTGARFWVAWLYEALLRKVDAGLIAEVFGIAPPESGVEQAFNAISGRLNYCSIEDRDALLDEFEARGAFGDIPSRVVNVDQMREMLQRRISIGSHTVSHPILANLSPESRNAELRQSRDDLSAALGVEVATIAYPNGRAIPHNFDNDTITAASDAGYQCAVTSKRGPILPGANVLALPRLGVSQVGGMAKFALTLERFRLRARRASGAFI